MTSLQQTAMGGGSTTAKTASYVLVAADAGTVVQMNAAGATTITVNTALFAAGDTVQIQNVGAGVCTVTAGTATVSTSATLALKQYDAGSLYFNSTSAAIFFAVDAADGMANVLTTTGDTIYSSSGTTAARLGIGSTGQVLTVASGIPSWATPASGTTFVGVACYINGTASSFTQNVQATLSYPAEDFDTNTFHDNSTNPSRITIPTGYGGKYLVTTVTLTPDDWNGYGYTYLFKNGASMNLPSGLYNDGRFGSLTATSGVNQLVGASTFALAAGDYIEMKIQSAWTTATHAIYARFTATYLGA